MTCNVGFWNEHLGHEEGNEAGLHQYCLVVQRPVPSSSRLLGPPLPHPTFLSHLDDQLAIQCFNAALGYLNDLAFVEQLHTSKSTSCYCLSKSPARVIFVCVSVIGKLKQNLQKHNYEKRVGCFRKKGFTSYRPTHEYVQEYCQGTPYHIH